MAKSIADDHNYCKSNSPKVIEPSRKSVRNIVPPLRYRQTLEKKQIEIIASNPQKENEASNEEMGDVEKDIDLGFSEDLKSFSISDV